MSEKMSSDHLKLISHPLVQHKLTVMRDTSTPTAQFRLLLREISQLMAYEVTRDLKLTTKTIETPLQKMEASVLAGRKPALVSILRAGNGMLDGLLDVIPAARVGFVGLYRDEVTLRPVQYYSKLPDHIEDRTTIVVDPMLATGNSASAAIEMIKDAGARNIRFMCLLAAPEGVQILAERHPDVPVFTAALDQKLNEKGYIVPGLGDAGDRIYGTG